MGARGSRTWLWMLVAFMFLSQTGLNLARPQMSYKLIALDASPFVIGLVTSAYAILPVFAAISLGRLAQRMERLKLMVIAGGALIGLGTALLALAGDIVTVAVAGMVFGLGHLVSQIGIQSAVSRYSTDSMLDAGFGWTTAGLSAGQLVGPLLGGLILGLHPDPTTGERLSDIALASWIGAGFALISLPLMLVPFAVRRMPTDTAMIDAAQAPGVARDAGKPTTFGILRRPGVPSHMLASLAMLSITDILTSFLPLVGEEAGVGPVWIGVLLAIRSLSSIVSRMLIRVLSARWYRSQLVIVSLVAGAVTVAAVPLLITVLPAAMALMLVGGFFLGLSQPLTMTMTIKTVPVEWRSSALAVRLTGNRVGQVVIPLAAGAVAAPLGPAGAIWFTCLLLAGSAGEKIVRYARTGPTAADS
ncbi:MFS transporter [Rothia sp. AR01]|uniref:MFS transporter n=1 Tax=Rothia santali TaxID=2949643 RepID=A0A9X2KIY1_9MICC|nr:MFS transporter [Rothia santali]MCP3426309.1 MFS transporter [Rothia santali]